MIKLINNEFNKVKKSKLIFSYILLVISLVIMNKYSSNSIFDMSYYLIPFIGVFISLIFSGSICEEIQNGTMRYYLTKPFKRYKVYISKIICILIYIIFSYLVITSCVSIIGNSFMISYYHKFFIHLVPIIFMSSYILYLSVIFKSHVFVSCTSILTLCFSLTLSQLLFGIKINFIEYTFLPYLDYSIFNDKLLINEMNMELGTHLNIMSGVIIDIVFFFIFLFLGIKLFCKKDIKM